MGRMIGDRWGVTDGEMARTIPCDDFVSAPAPCRRGAAFDIDGPCRLVWPWVAQVRLAPYSYDWIDNLGRPSPRELTGLPEPDGRRALHPAGGRQAGGSSRSTPASS